jgi:hypothetical protein
MRHRAGLIIIVGYALPVSASSLYGADAKSARSTKIAEEVFR